MPDPQATSSELEKFIEKNDLLPMSGDEKAKILQVIDIGKRNLQWLQLILKSRPASPDQSENVSVSQKYEDVSWGFNSMTNPSRTSGTIILEAFEADRAHYPKAMLDILMGQGELPVNPPVDFEVYKAVAGRIDYFYQKALRWQMNEPYLDYYSSQKVRDVRGYYFLNLRPNLKSELEHWDTLSSEVRAQIEPWLLQNCYMRLHSEETCANQMQASVLAKNLFEFHRQNFGTAKWEYDSMLILPSALARREIVWNDLQPNEMTVPFRTPEGVALQESLKTNIEDEWKWQDWHLRLSFQPSAAIHVQFEAGVVPHVNEAGGDTITMDALSPLTEETVKYAFRHEFGHILGFRDCYLEFYDPKEKAMIAYAIDPANVMCARTGRFQEFHFKELKKAYFNRKNRPI